jgi:hypothetical protein
VDESNNDFILRKDRQVIAGVLVTAIIKSLGTT